MNHNDQLTFIGFGEAAMAFVQGWGDQRPARIAAYDVKTGAADACVRDAKSADYARWNVTGCQSLGAALQGAPSAFSVVTADQAYVAAGEAATVIEGGTLFFDCNSCAPGTKRRSAALVEAAGGRYVDVAVMAPVHPTLHKTPLLVSGPHAQAAVEALGQLGMNATQTPGEVGAASSIKMIRSIMIKGLEALVMECVLAGRSADVDGPVIASLEASFPGFDWKNRVAYMLERVTTHGIRRAAEMREVAFTVEELGLPADMAHAIVQWQQRIGDLHLVAPEGDYRHRADALLAKLTNEAKIRSS